MSNSRICYWTVAWSGHSYMAQTLVDSFNKFNIQGDFIVFSDIKIKNCIHKDLDPKIKLNLQTFLFKFEYLAKLFTNKDYDYYIFIDCDSIFVRKPSLNPMFFMQRNNPWHCFLESPINSEKTIRPDWWGVPNKTLEDMYRRLGVSCQEIRNMNAGYWICKREFIPNACDLGTKCMLYFLKNKFKTTEEIPMAYIANYIPTDNKFHFHENYFDYWASDWTGEFANRIPTDTEWTNTSYMTNEKTLIRPAIVHAMRSKDFLIKTGFESLKLYS